MNNIFKFSYFLLLLFLLGNQSSVESRLYTLNRELMCPVCDGLTLEQSQSGPALEMKEEIKKMIVDGKSNDEIKDFFVKKYGKNILSNPPKEGFDNMLWLAPIFFGLLGIFFIYKYFFS